MMSIQARTDRFWIPDSSCRWIKTTQMKWLQSRSYFLDGTLFFGIAYAGSFARDMDALYSTWKKCTYASVFVTCVGLADDVLPRR